MADFGATLAGVRRLLPTITIPPADAATTVPDEADVAVWLAEFTGNVARRLGDLGELDAATVLEVHQAAAGLVHLAVAATVFDAHFPERAGVTEQSYGAVLWERYTTGLDELDDEVEELRSGDAGEGPELGATPRYQFPEPAFPDNLVV